MEDPDKESVTTKIQLEQSDIISFHDYGWPEVFEGRIQELERMGRPILCTEYMARGAGSTFDGSLPIAKQYHVAAMTGAWLQARRNLPTMGFQTKPYVLIQPTLWFHDVFRQDGTPYRQHEVDLIRQLTERGTH